METVDKRRPGKEISISPGLGYISTAPRVRSSYISHPGNLTCLLLVPDLVDGPTEVHTKGTNLWVMLTSTKEPSSQRRHEITIEEDDSSCGCQPAFLFTVTPVLAQ